MNQPDNKRETTIGFQLICMVVNHGMGSKMLHDAKEHGVCGGTILLGKGTIKNTLLNFLSLYDERKEIVLIGTEDDSAKRTIENLNKKYRFEKPNHGIVFTTSIGTVLGSTNFNHKNHEKRGATQSMYQLIISIVNKGQGEDVIDAATKAGSKGGTIINGRGSGIHETAKLFNMEIEPEKEIVMILSKTEGTERIVESIRENLKIEDPGKGVIFVQDVNQAYGIYE